MKNHTNPKPDLFVISSRGMSNIKSMGSSFIGIGFPVSDFTEFQMEIKKLWEEYTDATHICYAARIFKNSIEEKWSDDGEPCNSAGRPILRILQSENLIQIGFAVVRYYGGKKLGVSGLIHAYQESTIECLKILSKTAFEPKTAYQISFPFELTNQIQKLLNQFQAEIQNKSFVPEPEFTIQIKNSDITFFETQLNTFFKVKWVKMIA